MLEKEEPIKDATYFSDVGNETDDFKNAVAYKTPKYNYIKEVKGKLYVKGSVITRTDSARCKWRKVGPVCLMNYLKYLRTNQEYGYNLADRNRDE